MLSLKQLSIIVKDHLNQNTQLHNQEQSNKWTIGQSGISGRGLIAVEDIRSGEVLFVDHPIIVGPRSSTNVQTGCTVCGKNDSEILFQCDNCCLLLCSHQCQSSKTHSDDCIIISGWGNKVPIENVNDTLLSRCLAPIRILSLNTDQQKFMNALQAHAGPQHGSEIRELTEYFDIPADEEELITIAACILDANAFEIGNPYGRKTVSRRGLYPVSSLMNHNCVPNTKHTFNEDNHMIVKAVKPIPAGTELTTCYSGVLWGTPARRLHLFKTKHFWCKCERCSDPTERGTFLAALKCFESSCPSALLPVEPLNPNSAWCCLSCKLKVPNSNISAIQSALGSLIGSLNFKNISELEKFYLDRVFKYIPRSNQIVVDLQCRIVFEFGEIDGCRWHELSESRLELKEGLCRNILTTVTALGLGDIHLRGLLLYHLHATLAEKARRTPELYEELKAEIEDTIQQAYDILQGNIASPPDLKLRYQYLGPGSQRPHEERFFILTHS
ncbi:unnamed protein product [Leptosia nina]|uniref:SET domain-containing protein n=1 Tax=Leptosia nina TaxID=320188 RepID=A0AAV1JNE1_9NEOP